MRASVISPVVAPAVVESASLQRRTQTAQGRQARSIDTSPRQVAQAQRAVEIIGASVQPKLAGVIDHSPRLTAQAQRKDAIFGAPVQQQKAAAHHALPHAPEEDELRQRKAAPAAVTSTQATSTPNRTGLPHQLKAGVEALSGMSLEGVKVHYNSSKPAQLHAHAYAQGSDIHIAPGQEKHLPHEAWHVVQQAQGRVKPTMQMKGGVPVNDDAGLEREADVMGARALAGQAVPALISMSSQRGSGCNNVLQGRFWEYNPDGATEQERYIWHRGPVIGLLWEKKDGDTDGGQEQHDGYGVWLRKFTAAHTLQGLKRLTPANRLNYQSLSNIASDLSGSSIRQPEIGGQLSREAMVEDLARIKRVVDVYQAELSKALKQYASCGLMTLGVTVTAGAFAQYFLSLPGVPWPVKMGLDIAGLLYGAYVSHRWMTTDLMPLLFRVGLVVLNAGNWSYVLYTLITEALNGRAFQTVHIAALPFALTIEFALRRLMAKVEERMKKDESTRLLGDEQV